MSPEALRQNRLSKQSDVYSFGPYLPTTNPTLFHGMAWHDGTLPARSLKKKPYHHTTAPPVQV
jgi:hypothetical protein